jgi:hypothetical protein
MIFCGGGSLRGAGVSTNKVAIFSRSARRDLLVRAGIVVVAAAAPVLTSRTLLRFTLTKTPARPSMA